MRDPRIGRTVAAVSYRDDLEAAQARAEAAERRAAALQSRVELLERQQAEPTPEQRSKQVPIPDRFEVVVVGDNTMRVRWRSFRVREYPFLLLFCLCWDGFLIAAFVGTIVTNAWSWSLLICIPHVIIGVALTWFLLAVLLNRTTVSASPGRLRIEHGPIRWGGNHELSRADLQQLYVKSIETKQGPRHELYALLTDGEEVELVDDFDDIAAARYLEHALELHMRIQDQPVVDEAR